MKTKKVKAIEVPVLDAKGRPMGKYVWHIVNVDDLFLMCPSKPTQLPCGSWCAHFSHDKDDDKKEYVYCKGFKVGELVEVVKHDVKALTPDGKQGKIIRPN